MFTCEVLIDVRFLSFKSYLANQVSKHDLGNSKAIFTRSEGSRDWQTTVKFDKF